MILTSLSGSSLCGRTGRKRLSGPMARVDHLSEDDAKALRGAMAMKRAPISAEIRATLRRDLNSISECAQRKGLELDRYSLRREMAVGSQQFELGCWLHFYSTRVYATGTWARIDCVRRLLLAEYEQLNPSYDFFTVFDFGERQFDTCFEMDDSQSVMLSIMPLRSIPAVNEKFQQVGWTEEYLMQRGYPDTLACASLAKEESSQQTQRSLFGES